MAERRTIGQILMSFGRITEADVERALRHQQKTGGYFGEALLALGIVSQEELEWGLASQFDLPYVFPDADSIDPLAADMVTPEWALSHLTLPIMKTTEALTVIVDSPIKTRAVDELQLKTDLRIDLALASAGKIRELIRQVYARAHAADESEPTVPMAFQEFVSQALDAGAVRLGVSVRQLRASGWFEDGGRVRRRLLNARWEGEMDELLSPSAEEKIQEASQAAWQGLLSRDGMVTPVEVRYLASGNAREFLFRPVKENAGIRERFQAPSQGVLSEIRLLVRSGSARFGVSATPPGLGEEILPYLPALLLDPGWRALHLAAQEHDDPQLFTVAVDNWGEEELKDLRAFHFDVVTAGPSLPVEEWLPGVLDLGASAFLLVPEVQDRRFLQDAGVRWEIMITRDEGGRLGWTLLPLTG
ncbi:MAG: hypothetical protein WEA09_01000 [Gemmatimonadota bacterium]